MIKCSNDSSHLLGRPFCTGTLPIDFEEILSNHRPVVINLDVLANIQHDLSLRDRIMDHVCIVTNNYRDAIDSGDSARQELHQLTISDYMAAEADEIYPLAMISEECPPQDLIEGISLPEALQPKRHSRLFAGRKGCVSDLHCDWLSYWICHIPIFGEKHVILLPPESGSKIAAKGNLSSLRVREFSDSEREELLNLCSGIEFYLGPGEILMLPPFWWHHFTYKTDAVALSVGFGKVDEYTRSFIADPEMPRVSLLATVYHEMIRAAPLEINQRALFDVVRREWTAKPMRHSMAFAALAEARASLK
jgi:hypothetical protein